MKRRHMVAFAATATLAISASAGTAFAVQEVTPSCPGPGTSTCLLDQTGLASFQSVLSDHYTEARDGTTPPDEQDATPFTVPAGQAWTVNEFDTIGGFVTCDCSAGPPSGINIWVYKDNNGAIGAEVFHLDNVDAPNGPHYVVQVPAPFPVLQPGKYWFSAQAENVTYNQPDGYWFWTWSIAGGGQALASTRAATPLPSPALFGVAGAAGAPTAPTAPCGAVSADAKYFKPRHPVRPTLLGVRARVTASQPSDVTATAHLQANGKTVDLGTFTKNVTTFKKLRIPVPRSLHLSHGDKVTLLLHTVTKPHAGGSCQADTRDFTIKTRIINIQRSLADR
ncbi:MAG: hypothetical protein QOD60_1618 [Solirubrobacterales bacterium]|nr:hypothetical protein [Solirubrobacterales bacterium]